MNHEQKITNNIQTPNNEQAILHQHFPQCFDKDGNFLLEKFAQHLQQKEVVFSTESYGLQWLGKSYARLLASEPATTLLKADQQHNQQTAHQQAKHLLIKGDNLEVLKHLANAYHEKIKMIYIDPPYNTGSDGFVYQDNRKFTAQQLQQAAGISEEKAKRILAFTQSNSNSHSAWLTFMYPRLYIAKHLLKDDGVIFVSIDDNEVAQLRLLMDEIFGEENFVNEFVWKKKNVVQNDAKFVSTDHEYLLCFAKDIAKLEFNLLQRTQEQEERYSNPDNDKRGVWTSVALQAKSGSNIYEVTFPNGITWKPVEGTYPRLSKTTLLQAYEEGRLWFGKDGKNVPRLKKYLSEVKSGILPNSVWLNESVGSTQLAKEYLKNLLEANVFDTPKPIPFLKKMLDLSTSPTDLVLDFFAGSGTTGDAVMQLNAEDGGQRQYILVQLPEAIEEKKNKAAYDFVTKSLQTEPTIFAITKERLTRAAQKINAQLDEKNEQLAQQIKQLQNELHSKDTQAAIAKLEQQIEKQTQLQTQNAFKIYETMPIWDDYDFEAETFEASQSLFDPGKLTETDLQALLTTWKTNDNILLTQELQTICLPFVSEQKPQEEHYTAYYGNNKLYLMHKGFMTEHLVGLIEKIDADPDFNPTTIIAFAYHFDSKNLRELSENLQHYSYRNHKSIQVSFIKRY